MEKSKITGRKAQYVYFIKGVTFKSLLMAARALNVHKTTILRWCSSDKHKDCYREPVKTPGIIEGGAGLSPLDFLLSVVRDETQDPKLRIMAAKYALPYVAAKKAGGDALGKKEEKQEKAKQAGSGRFAASKPPLKIIR